MATVPRDVFRPIGSCETKPFDKINATNSFSTAAVDSAASGTKGVSLGTDVSTNLSVQTYGWLHLTNSIQRAEIVVVGYFKGDDILGLASTTTLSVYAQHVDWDPTTLNWSNQPALGTLLGSITHTNSDTTAVDNQTWDYDPSELGLFFYRPSIGGTTYGLCIVPTWTGIEGSFASCSFLNSVQMENSIVRG